jgi:integrase
MPTTTTPTVTPADHQLIDELLLEWRASERARDNARYTLSGFARWLDADGATLTTATREQCRAWLAERAGQVAASTCVKNWSELKAFYAAAAADYADPLEGRRSPMTGIPMPRAPKFTREHVATVDEYERLLAAVDRRATLGLRNAIICSLMFRSGLRVGELAQINLVDVDLERRCIDLGLTKNDEPRLPPLHPDTVTMLRRYLRRRGDTPGPLFVNVGTRATTARITTNAIQTMFKRTAARAGVALTPHSLRRGFVVEYLAHGGDIATVMIIGGWASEVMVYRYLGEARARTAQTVFDKVAARQVAATSRELRALRAVRAV